MAEQDDELESDEQEEQDTPKKKRKKKKKKRGWDTSGAVVYYLSSFGFLFTIKNMATVLAILIGIGLVIMGFVGMAYTGVFGIPFLFAGFGLIVLSLALRFVFFAE